MFGFRKKRVDWLKLSFDAACERGKIALDKLRRGVESAHKRITRLERVGFHRLAESLADVARKVARLEDADLARTVTPDNMYVILEDLKARMPKGSAVSDHRHNELAGSVARLESKIAAMSTPHREGNLENLHCRVRALETANREAKAFVKEQREHIDKLDLVGRVKRLEQEGTTAATMAAIASDLTGRAKRLDHELSDLRNANNGLASTVAKLEKRLEQLEVC